MNSFVKLKTKLAELFQLDQADLDFGIYRIMNARREEINRFLERDLLPQVQEAFKQYQSADKATLKQELDKAIEAARALQRLKDFLTHPHEGFKCVFLGHEGFLWRIKPIVCEMFLCDAAKNAVLKENLVVRKRWDALVRQRKDYTWPDRPVLFDTLEPLRIPHSLAEFVIR